MKTPNIGWLFYRDYFKVLEQSDKLNYEVKSQRITRQGLSEGATAQLDIPHSFELKTTYPGLLLGCGYQHETGGDGEFKIGFFFDFTTGLPQLPGSSVKGTLRSVFPFHKKDFGENFTTPRIQFLQSLLEKITGTTPGTEAIRKLEEEIFEGVNHSGEEPARISHYQRDRFYDGLLSESNHPTEQRPILASDYVTPHKKPLENPIPLMFLKVRPEVIFKFHFSLQNSKVIPELTAEKKLQLFKEILVEFGIGAKTNVGYGQFSTDPNIRQHIGPAETVHNEPVIAEPRPPRRQFEPTILPECKKELVSGKSFPGEIIGIEGDYAFIAFNVDKKQCVIRKNHTALKKMDKTKVASPSELAECDPVNININKDYQIGDILNCSVTLTNK
ncbi:MAG: type III-B CRISPR module RAMP protein Cmr6 [Bacteroidota bacterium]